MRNSSAIAMAESCGTAMGAPCVGAAARRMATRLKATRHMAARRRATCLGKALRARATPALSGITHPHNLDRALGRTIPAVPAITDVMPPVEMLPRGEALPRGEMPLGEMPLGERPLACTGMMFTLAVVMLVGRPPSAAQGRIVPTVLNDPTCTLMVVLRVARMKPGGQGFRRAQMKHPCFLLGCTRRRGQRVPKARRQLPRMLRDSRDLQDSRHLQGRALSTAGLRCHRRRRLRTHPSSRTPAPREVSSPATRMRRHNGRSIRISRTMRIMLRLHAHRLHASRPHASRPHASRHPSMALL